MALAASPAIARVLPPAPWIEIAPGRRLAVLLDGPGEPPIAPSWQSAGIAREFLGMRALLHRRVGFPVVDFCPKTRVPLYVSAGLHTVARRDQLIDVDRSGNDWQPSGATERFTFAHADDATEQMPRAALGYQHVLAGRLLFGVEGGGALVHAPGYRSKDAAHPLVPGQYLGDGRLTLDPMVIVYLSTAL